MENENNNVQSILSEPTASGTLNGNDTFAEQAEGIKTREKEVRKKSVMLFVATVLVIVVLIALAIAWYTRVANTYAVTFDVADYDLSVNENVDDEYLLNVYKYAELTGTTTDTTTGAQHTMMAPGTIGWIPLKISAYHSDVNVKYYISLDSKMPEKLYKHMRFFVLAEANPNPKDAKMTGEVSGSLVGQNSTKYEFVYGDALESVSDINSNSYQKIYLDQAYTDEQPNSSQSTVISDEIKITGDDKVKTLCIYWEWYLDAQEAADDGKPGAPVKESDGKVSATDIATWDSLDTDVGRYPDKYYDAFTMYIKTTGTQVTPTPTNGQRKKTTTGTNK